ncbi:MAG: asparagine synthase (glutamine-hydrolyzing) [Flavobacterium sp.]|nr:asparagine synthase (glutamine-hydrolyzing) [Flavobacterium sp.]
MCRIAGIVDSTSTTLKEDILKMRDAMHRGGPDDSGLYFHNKLALGHRRLSIIDLSSAGHQPMINEDENLVLSYNGEIYNYKEIRSELEANGIIFKTKTDTEVLLKAFEKWGNACFEKFNGMFSLAIYNKAKNEMTLARDHAGIKPLYYFFEDGKLYFASEIRAFKALKRFEENPDWRIYFLAFGHLPEPITTLKGVSSLQKGTILTLNTITGETTTDCFSQFQFAATINNEKEALAQVKEVITAAVARHLISDAPIGLFLSGGIDSSLLTLLAQPILKESLQTLSIVFDEEAYSERKFQEIIIQKTGANHSTFTVSEEHFYEALPDVLLAMDQPTTDGINSYFICKYAKQAGLTAVLSGLGADELFGGYNSFVNSSKITQIKKWIPRSFFKLAQYLGKDKYQKVAFLNIKGSIGEYLFHRGFLCPSEISKILEIKEQKVWELLNVLTNYYVNNQDTNSEKYNSLAPFNKATFQEVNLYMQNQLLKDSDCTSMWHAVEVRVPFLDKEVQQLAYSIAPEIKAILPKKSLLINAFTDLLPKEIWNRPKMGFTFPFQDWLLGINDKNKTEEHASWVLTKKNQYAISQFKKGNYTWSRYWATILSQNLN